MLEESEDDFFAKESNSKFHHVAVNHLAVTGLFDSADLVTRMWSLPERTLET